MGVDYVTDDAEFLDRRRIKIGNKTYSAGKFIIATGARPTKPAIVEKNGASCLNNEAFFRLEKLPKSIIIIGGGPTGIEFACALRLLGLEVTVIEAADTILGAEDREMAGYVADYLSARGVTIHTGCKATSLKQAGGMSELTIAGASGEQNIIAERVLITVGQVANVEGLALEKAGVEYNSKASRLMRDSGQPLLTSWPAATSPAVSIWLLWRSTRGWWRPTTRSSLSNNR